MDKLIKVIAFQSVDFIGTYADAEIHYPSDIDLQEYVIKQKSKDAYNDIYEHFKQVFKKIKRMPYTYITDFKCGRLPNTSPIRWKYEDTLKGYKNIEDTTYKFIDCLQQQSIIKIDLIQLNPEKKEIKEISINYYFDVGSSSTYQRQSYENINTSLLIDFKDYLKEGNYYKALKRLYAYYRLVKGFNPQKKTLIKFFNSSTGKMSKYKSYLETTIELINQDFKRVNNKIIYEDILPTIYKNLNIPFYPKRMSKKVMMTKIDTAINKTNHIIKYKATDFYESFKKKFTHVYLPEKDS